MNSDETNQNYGISKNEYAPELNKFRFFFSKIDLLYHSIVVKFRKNYAQTMSAS